MERSEKLGRIIQLGEVAKLGVVLVGVAYGVGVVISNGYLAGLGIVDFSLLRPQAVLSGLWVMVFFAVGVIADDSVTRALEMHWITRTQRALNAAVALGGALIFYYGALIACHLGLDTGRAVIWTSLFASLLIFTCVGTTIVEGQNAVKEWKRRRSDKIVGPTSAAFFVFHCMNICVALVIFSAFFITKFYRFVPQEFGGARPRQVQIAVTDMEASTLRRISVPTTNDVLDDPVQLVHEGTDDVVILPKVGTVVILPRREILAIRVK